jgi:hypothetical protein
MSSISLSWFSDNSIGVRSITQDDSRAQRLNHTPPGVDLVGASEASWVLLICFGQDLFGGCGSAGGERLLCPLRHRRPASISGPICLSTKPQEIDREQNSLEEDLFVAEG